MKDLKDNKEFYQRVGKRQGWSFDKMKYTKISSRDFDYYKYLSKNIKNSDRVLDIGCGDSKKVIQFVNAKEIIGIDNSSEMIKKSQENLVKYNSQTPHSFLLMDGDGNYSFKDNSFDFVINRHCGCNIYEMYRILKPNGKYIQEDVDETDCLELKILFGRGQNYPIANRISNTVWKIYKELGFSKIEFYPIREIEFYQTKQDLKYLLCNTPIIPNFGESKQDKLLFNQYCKTHKTEQGIRLERELFGFILTK